MVLYASAQTSPKTSHQDSDSPTSGERIRAARARSKEARCLRERVDAQEIIESRVSFLYRWHSNRASDLHFINSGVLDILHQEFRRGVLSIDEYNALAEQQEATEILMREAYNSCVDAAKKELAQVAFCKVRSLNKAHAQHLERLRAHTTFEVDPICTESLLHNSQEAHAPPIKNSGADRVTPKPHLTHPHRSTLRGPSG